MFSFIRLITNGQKFPSYWYIWALYMHAQCMQILKNSSSKSKAQSEQSNEEQGDSIHLCGGISFIWNLYKSKLDFLEWQSIRKKNDLS